MSTGLPGDAQFGVGGELCGRGCSLGSWLPAVGSPLVLPLRVLEDARLLLRALAAGEALTWGRDMRRPSAF